MKPYLLRVHRWIALVFSLPLLAVVLTGLVLSFEPAIVTQAIKPGLLSVERIEDLVVAQDKAGLARSITYRSYDGTLTIGGGRGARGTLVDVASGQVASQPSRAASLFGTARGLHETLLFDLRWVVITSTAAMAILIVIGTFMGWPRFANTLGGWHRGVAWVLLPLLLLSPITGLMMSAGLTLTSASPPAAQGQTISLLQAVRSLGKDHDLSTLVWLRPQGGRVVARLAEGGEYRLYAVAADGVSAMPRNWPRLWHEGNFAGVWSSLMNAVISIAMLVLLVTGVLIWFRRSRRRRARPRTEAAVAGYVNLR